MAATMVHKIQKLEWTRAELGRLVRGATLSVVIEVRYIIAEGDLTPSHTNWKQTDQSVSSRV